MSNQAINAGRIKEIWRYPVKSMGGESLQNTTIIEGGIHGDCVGMLSSVKAHVKSLVQKCLSSGVDC